MLGKLNSFSQTLSPGLRKILTNIGWLSADRFLQMGLGLVVGLWVARYLGPSRFGLLNYSLAIIGLFSSIARLGLDGIVIREVVREPLKKNEILGTTFTLRFLGGSVATLLCIAAAWILPTNEEITRWLISILSLITLFESFGTIDLWLNSQVQAKYVTIARNLSYALVCAVRVILIQMEAPLVAFAFASLSEIIMFGIGLCIVYRWTGGAFKAWRWSTKRAISLLKDSWPLIISSIVIMIYMRTDQIMLGQLSTAAAVGIYSATVRLSELWYFAPMAIMTSVFPSIIRSKDANRDQYQSRLLKLFTLLTVMAYAVAIGVTIFSRTIVELSYGDDYLAAAPILVIHIWTGVFVSLGVAANSCLIAENLTRFSALVTAIGAVINVVLNFLLIPTQGAVGAALATVVAQIFASYISYGLYPRTREIFVLQSKALSLVGLLEFRSRLRI